MRKPGWLVLLLFSGMLLMAQEPAINSHNGIALEGYDPVSYFDAGPVKGDSLLIFEDQGVIYHFTNRANLQKFRAHPAKYRPKYGGWCAYAMGVNGEKVAVDPKTYKLIDGELYLFYNAFLNNTLKKWNRDEASLLPRADDNWNKKFN